MAISLLVCTLQVLGCQGITQAQPVAAQNEIELPAAIASFGARIKMGGSTFLEATLAGSMNILSRTSAVHSCDGRSMVASPGKNCQADSRGRAFRS